MRILHSMSVVVVLFTACLSVENVHADEPLAINDGKSIIDDNFADPNILPPRDIIRETRAVFEEMMVDQIAGHIERGDYFSAYYTAFIAGITLEYFPSDLGGLWRDIKTPGARFVDQAQQNYQDALGVDLEAGFIKLMSLAH